MVLDFSPKRILRGLKCFPCFNWLDKISISIQSARASAGDMLQYVVILSVVHVLNLRTIMHNIVISFSINYITTKIVFVNTLLCQMKCYSKIQNLHFFWQKVWLLIQIINNVRSIKKSDPAIQIEPTTYCNISPICRRCERPVFL